MPSIAYAQSDLNKLYDRVSPSVVSVNSYATNKYDLEFTTGFIVYSDNHRSLVCVHHSVIKKNNKLYVHFNDNTTEKAAVFLKKTISGHAVLVTQSTSGLARRVVTFSQCEPRREEIFMITEVEGGYSGFNFMTGTIISPSCFAVDISTTKTDHESKRKFALTCPAGNPEDISEQKKKLCKEQIPGAPVFDLEGLLIGAISSMDQEALKFAHQACHWVNKLEAELKAKDQSISLSKMARPGASGTKEPDGTKKRKLNDYDEDDGDLSPVYHSQNKQNR